MVNRLRVEETCHALDSVYDMVRQRTDRRTGDDVYALLLDRVYRCQARVGQQYGAQTAAVFPVGLATDQDHRRVELDERFAGQLLDAVETGLGGDIQAAGTDYHLVQRRPLSCRKAAREIVQGTGARRAGHALSHGTQAAVHSGNQPSGLRQRVDPPARRPEYCAVPPAKDSCRATSHSGMPLARRRPRAVTPV